MTHNPHDILRAFVADYDHGQTPRPVPGVDIVIEDTTPDNDNDNDNDWAPVNLAAIAERIRSGNHQPTLPTVLHVEGGIPLFYPERTNSLFGESGGGKTWVALAAIADVVRNGGNALLVDYEDTANGITERLVTLGLDDDQIGRIDYRNPTTGILLGIMALEDATTTYDLAVIDSTGEAMAAAGVDSNSDREVAQWFAMIKQLTRLPGRPAVIVLDHVPKDKEAPTAYAIGSQRKRAAISGASYRVDTVREPAKGRDGKLKLTVAKDRHGNRPKGSTACELDIISTDSAVTITARISDTQAALEAGGKFRPTVLMERVSKCLEATQIPMSSRGIERVVTGKATAIRTAIEALIDEGFARHDGTGIVSVKAFRNDEFSPTDAYRVPASPVRPTASRDAGKTGESGPRPRVPDIHKSGTRDAGRDPQDEAGENGVRPASHASRSDDEMF